MRNKEENRIIWVKNWGKSEFMGSANGVVNFATKR